MTEETEQTKAPESRVIQVKIEEELKTSFLDYSLSFIPSRALPYVRETGLNHRNAVS